MPTYDQHAALLKTLAHPARLQMLDMLRQGETCVCHFQAVLQKRQPYVSQQLMFLREAGLVDSRKAGNQTYYQLIDEQVERLLTAVLGPFEQQPHQVIDDCHCPQCIVARHEQAALTEA